VLATIACGGCHWTGGGFRADGRELPRLRQVLALEAGKVVADVGAGKGELTRALSQEVGPAGRVYSTEIDAARLNALRAAGLGNVTVVEAQRDASGLPPNCCDAIVLRRVYHHLTEPAGINASLLQALRPGGVLVVIDFPPPFFWARGSLGVAAKEVVSEVAASGFELLQLLDDWPGRGPLQTYCAVFRKPRV
jgi:predicted methyltransferase